jgi:hypothetical protein
MSWSNIEDKFTINDIGAQLLENLARGIYNHEAVLREYVQNACDAYAQLGGPQEHELIRISIEDEETIAIQDNGIGMNLTDIKNCKKIAVSPKSEIQGMTGFRGIGIWAGFQACNQLEVITTKANDKKRYRLQIDFADILKHVNDNINIGDLLNGRFRIEADETRKEEHYTRVRLVGLQGDYSILNQREEIERIVSQILPCKVDPKFEYADKIAEFYNELDSFQEYSILVEGGEVFKQFPSDLDEPSFVSLELPGEEYGRAWYCMSAKQKKESLPAPTPSDLKRNRSFRLRIRNFGVGGVGIYSDEDASGLGILTKVNLRSSAHLNWHVGEIHVTNVDVRPDTPRSALELDTASRRAIVAIRSFYEDRISESRAYSDFNGDQRALERSEAIVGGQAVFDAEEARTLIQRLEQQDELIRSRPTDKFKKKHRDLLKKRDYTKRLRQAITSLKAKAPQAASTQNGTTTTSSTRPANSRSRSSSKASQQQPTNGSANGATTTSTTEVIDYELLLSEIFEAVKKNLDLGIEDDRYPLICAAIQQVLEARGLITVDA